MRILKKIRRAVTAKLLTAIAAVGLFSPVPAHASDITDKDGASLIKSGDKVHNLYAQDIDNNLAVSRYGKFKLSQNEIANLFFNRQGESVFADTLVNFVDNKIDINGTVNAIRNGAIDGNLYFLTPEGIAVGTSGVINAGSVNLHSIDYSTWFALDNASVADIGNQLADLNKHIGSGTIDVKGVVNARHNINLAAQTVKVAGSLNQSPSLDFKDYVNAGSTVNNISNLKMTVDGNGDILIDDAISIHAYAKSDTSELLDLDTSDPTAALLALWRHIGSSSADVNITGSLNAGGNIDITADSTIKFAEGQHYNLLSSVKTFAEKISVAASFIKKLENYDLSASIVSQRNSAGITVGKNAKLNAGNNINLDAKSTVTFDYNTTVANKKFVADDSKNSIGISLNALHMSGAANINGAGEMTAGGDINLNAVNNAAFHAATSSYYDDTKDTDKKIADIYAGAGVYYVSDSAKITVGKVNASGKFNATADNTADISKNVHAIAPNAEKVATSAAIAWDNNSSNVTLNGDINAAEINVNVKNTVGNVQRVQNSIDEKDLSADNPESVVTDSNTLSALSNDISNELPEDMKDTVKNAASFDIGAAVNIAVDTNSSDIIVAEGVKLDAAGNVNLNSKLNLDKQNFSAVNVTDLKQITDDKTNVGGSVNVAAILNSADVTLKKNSALTGADIKLQSNFADEVNRLDNARTIINAAWNDLVANKKKLDKNFVADSNIQSKIKELKDIDSVSKFVIALADIHTLIQEKYGDVSDEFDPSTLVNFYSRAELQDVFSLGTASKMNIAGSGNFFSLNSSARTLLAEGVNVNSTGTVDLLSDNTAETFSLTGTGGAFLTPNFSGKKAAGASLAIGDLRGDAITAVGKNVSINTPSTLNIKSAHSADETGVVYGAGISGTSSFNGMLNLVTGGGNAITAVDDEVNINADNVNINADNKSDIDAVSGALNMSFATSSGTSQSAIGVAVNLVDFDVNSIAAIFDTAADNDFSDEILTDAEIAAITDAINKDFEEASRDAALKKALKKARIDKWKNDPTLIASYDLGRVAKSFKQKLGSRQYLLGSKTVDNARGSIVAKEFNIGTTSAGDVNSIAMEGSASTDVAGSMNPASKLAAANQYVNNITSLTSFSDVMTLVKVGETAYDNLPNAADYVKGNSGNIYNASKDAGFEAAGKKLGSDDKDKDKDKDTSTTDAIQFPTKSPGSAKKTSVAGSISFVSSDGNTASVVNNVDITVDKDADVISHDDLFNGSFAGGASVNWIKKGNSSMKTSSTALGGAVAFTQSKRIVSSIVDHADIKGSSARSNPLNLSILADKQGTSIAAGIGLAATVSDSDATNIAAGIGLDFSDNAIHAVTNDSAVNNFDNISIDSAVNDLQITGGLSAGFTNASGKGSESGSNSEVPADDPPADDKTDEKTDGDKDQKNSSSNIGASLVFADVDNDIRAGAFNTNADVADTIDIHTTNAATQVNAGVALTLDTSSNASDKDFSGAATYATFNNNTSVDVIGSNLKAGKLNFISDEKENTNARRSELTDMGFDLDGSSYGGDSLKKLRSENDGKIIVAGALSVAVETGEEGVDAAAAVTINDIDNKNLIDIKNSTLNADSASFNAFDKTEIVNVSAGSADTGGAFGGSGSVGWNDLDVDSAVDINGSTINVKTIKGTAENDAHVINVAGEINISGGKVAGLGLAFNSVENEASVKAKDTVINAPDGTVDFTSKNGGTINAAAVALNISTGGGVLNGNVAINMGANDTKAEFDNVTADSFNSITLKSNETTTKNTIAGAVDVSINRASDTALGSIGASIAFSQFGTSSDKNSLLSSIKNSTFKNTTDNSISIEAKDNSTLNTIAAGVGVSAGKSLVGAQGGAAVTLVNKDVKAVASDNTLNGKSDLSINADTESDITTVGAVVSGTGQSYINAAVAVAVNKLYQDTNAELSGDTSIANTVDTANVKALSNAKIASGSGSGALSIGSDNILTAAGSGAYNYIGSSTNATVDKVNFTAAKNFGVVAQSDDAISNYAGAVTGSNGTVGLGVGLSINSIDGDTAAKVSNSTINAAGSDSERIAVKHTVDDDAIIDSAISKDTWTATRLRDARKSENLSGLVIDASSTHALSSDIASLSVNLGNVAIAGSLNFNFINGHTNAELSSTTVNSNASNAGNVSVVAADYTNKGAFTGGAAGAKNFAAGLSSGWSTVERETNAIIDGSSGKKAINAKDFALKSIGRQGVSDWMLSAAVAIDSNLALATGDNLSRNLNKSTTKSALTDADVHYTGNADVTSDHASNVISLNTSGALAIATDPEEGIAGALNVGVAVSMDESTVQTTLDGANLLSTGNSSTANIGAANSSLINDDLYSIGAAIAPASAGLAADVAVNNLETTVQTALFNSSVSAKNLNVKTHDTVSLETSGGSGAFGTLAGVGANVAVGTSNNSVETFIKGGSSLNASDSLTVDTAESRTLKGTTTSVGASLAAGVAVNVNTLSVNSSIDDLEDNNTRSLVNGHIEDANKDDSGEISKYTYGLSDDERKKLDEVKASIKAGIGNPSAGVQTNIDNSSLTAGNALKISGVEKNDGGITNGAVGIGAASASVADSVINVKHDTKANVVNSTVKGKSVSINAQQTQAADGLKSTVFEAGAGVGQVGVGYNSLNTNGVTSINLAGSSITATNGNIDVKALDDTKLRLQNVSASAAVVGVPLTFGKLNNTSDVTISTDGDGDFNHGSLTASNKNINLRAERASDLWTEVFQVGAGVGEVAITHNDAVDDGNANVLIKRSDTAFNAKNINLTALNTPKVQTRTPAVTVAIVGFSNANSNAEVSGSTNVIVDSGNTFNAPTVNFTATSGKTKVTEADAYLLSVNAGAINIDPAPNTASAKSELSTNINVGDEIYAENTTLNLNAGSEVDRKAYADTYTIGIGVASGRDRGKTSSKDAVSISVGSNPSAGNSFNGLANLNIFAVNNPDSNLKALGAAGGILNIASQSYAENSSDNSASTSVNGSWNLTGDLTMLASVDESVRETARQGSGEIAGGSGVYVDNTIKGNSSAVVGTDAVINASNVDISAKNVIDTNGFDGDKYALVDYFGGGIVIDGLTSTLTYDRDAGVKIQGSVNTTGDQTYTARSDGTVRNKIIAEGGSIGGSTIARSFSTVDYDDTIKLTGTLKSSGALNAIANDAIAVDTSAVTKVGGGVEVLIGKTESTINRTNLIKVDGTVGSTNDLTFNAGGTKDDLFSDQIQTKIDTLVETSNYSVVPISVNNAIAKINSNSQIDISSSGKVNGGSDVYLTANGGALSTFTTQYQWAWVDGGGTTSKQRLDSTGDNLLGTDHNFVNVDGVLTAGASNPDINPDIVISIDGQAVPAGYSTSTAVSPLTISCSTDAVDISTGTVDYANELSNRLSLINSLITDYTMGALSNEALSGYLLERQRILDKLDELCLLEYATESAGKP